MEKRAFTRRPIQLAGTCSVPGKGSRGIEIRDFCTGGMLLAYSGPPGECQPEHGKVVDIRCELPNSARTLAFRGRIVRVEGEMAGLAFIDPDIEAVHALHDFAKRGAGAGGEPRAAAQKGLLPSPHLSACRAIGEAELAPIADEFLARVSDRLYDKAGMAQSIVEKNAFYDALAGFKKHGVALREEFITRMRQRFAATRPAPRNDMRQRRKPGAQGLSLVEDDVFEEWLVFSDSARKVELDHQPVLSELALRMSEIFGQPIDNENNPYAPSTFVQAFKDALRLITLSPEPARVAYATFRDTLSARAGELYDRLNDALAERGVLVDPSVAYRVRPNAPRGPHPVAPTVAQKFPDGATPAGNVSPHILAAGISSAPSGPHNWYELIQELETLKRQVAGRPQDVYTHVAENQPYAIPVSAPGPSEEPVHYADPKEMLMALNRIPSSALRNATAGSIKTQMLSVLAQSAPAGEKVELPRREEKILDVTETLLESALSDKLLASSVAPWLRQLSIPLLKTALRDESVFSDRAHMARQILNAVAELEFYGSDGGAPNAVGRKIESLLKEIESADDVSPELFQRVLRELNALIRIQHKAYEENVREVVLLEESQPSRALRAQRPPPGEEELVAEWHKRIRRLKVGHSVMLDADTTPRRLRIAWISKNFDRYVFVNVRGLKEQVLSADELVYRLRSGSALVLDDGGEPLVDRAQYSMLQKMHRHLLHETTHDALTGLINRREFERLVTEALADVRQHESQHVLCHLDLTQFNVVNSTFGYDGGDRALVEITELLLANFGQRAALARLGGDEFGVLFHHHSIESVIEIADQLKHRVGEYRFIQNEASLSLSYSAGLVKVSPEASGATELMQAAETSAHVARSKGSNYTKVFNAEDTGLHRQHEVTMWVTRIDRALDRQQLDLRYQPIVAIKDDSIAIHHSEILLGVCDESGNPISPAEFILAAEHFRRMVAVDRWVVERAFSWLADNLDQLPVLGGLAINLSGASLNEEGCVEHILQQAKRYAVPMERICFEVTETAGIENLSSASEFILALKETGCMFSLDDFGSGHSSYAYLKNLPVDFLKIDGAFIRKLDENPYDYAVVKSITEIGHFMGKKIIAEFVENESILRLLREIGVDYAQGYVIARPQNLSTLEHSYTPV